MALASLPSKSIVLVGLKSDEVPTLVDANIVLPLLLSNGLGWPILHFI
jgi:hypothetical protein